MNGVHDMGGMHGFGAVQPKPDEAHFHAAWEARALGLTLALGASGAWNLDQTRHARESLPPARYLSASYYGIWVLALQQLMRERGLATTEELADGRRREPARALPRVLRATDVDAVLARGAPTARTAVTEPRFAVGDRVVTRNRHPAGHTRVPRYARGRVGVVERLHGAHVFAEAHAASPPGAAFDEAPQWLYTVRFDGRELWGDDAEPGLQLSIDAWESTLEAAPETAS
jgi:nitrile hydratase beta subunit